MAWIRYNPNPARSRVGDCAVRAVAKATGQDWETSYCGLVLKGYELSDMPNANHVWGAYMREKGFKREIMHDDCPDCYTVSDFCRDNPKGLYVLAVDGHVVTIIDGNYHDSWNSGNEVVLYYWRKEE